MRVAVVLMVRRNGSSSGREEGDDDDDGDDDNESSVGGDDDVDADDDDDSSGREEFGVKFLEAARAVRAERWIPWRSIWVWYLGHQTMCLARTNWAMNEINE